MTRQEDIKKVIEHAIKSIGLDEFKKSSLFGSNEARYEKGQTNDR